MLYTMKNEFLTVRVNDLGAELWSVVSAEDGTEYIWQGDPQYWEDRSPVIFPFCGRVQNEEYSYGRKTYPMGCHGFAAGEVFAVSEEEGALRFLLRDTPKTREIYPFAFSFEVVYRLSGRRLTMSLAVKNEGEGILPFTMGAHPGFNVPLGGGEFEDFSLTFGAPSAPVQMEISEDGFRTGREEAYPLVEGRVLPLRHSLFDIDGIFLYGMASSVRLASPKSERFLEVHYSDMPYLGFWHSQGVANFLCIEPWCAMPAVKGESEDLEKKDGLFRIGAGECKRASLDMIFG